MKNKIYLKVPSNYIAGGVESLFQLSDTINNCDGKCIVLFDKQCINPIPEKYSHYKVEFSSEVEDIKDNWIIYPEVWTEQINEFKNLKKCIWWLSVDNNHSKFNDFLNDDIQHFYQSNYAMQYLIDKNTSNYLPIFDYISNKHLKNVYYTEEKENFICYNPVKGKKITDDIIKLNPHLKFVPLIDMNEDQIIQTLKLSKVYIDFGHHPGRDRIPREAAHLGNCIITNNTGSASYFNDVTIYKKYKTNNINQISHIINECLNSYDKNINNFSLYRSIIKNQKEQMFNQVKQLLS